MNAPPVESSTRTYLRWFSHMFPFNFGVGKSQFFGETATSDNAMFVLGYKFAQV